jgi:hypothetical protein
MYPNGAAETNSAGMKDAPAPETKKSQPFATLA